MKKGNKKRIFAIGLAVILIVLIIIISIIISNKSKNKNNTNLGEYEKILDDGTKINISTKLNEDKVFNNYTINNIRLTEKDNVTQLLANVVNNTDADITETKLVQVKLLDKDGNTISTVNGIIGALKVGESTQLNVNITSDLTNAYDFTIIIK